MSVLSRSALANALRSGLQEVASRAEGMIHSVWEHKDNQDNVDGFLIYRSAPIPTTPIVIWIDGEEKDPAVSMTYMIGDKSIFGAVRVINGKELTKLQEEIVQLLRTI